MQLASLLRVHLNYFVQTELKRDRVEVGTAWLLQLAIDYSTRDSGSLHQGHVLTVSLL